MITDTVIDAVPHLVYAIQMRIFALVLLVYGILLPPATQAAEPPLLELSEHLTARQLIGHLQAHLDEGRRFTIETIGDADFQTLPSRGVDFGYSAGAVWLRLRVRNDLEKTRDWRLHFRENFLPEIKLYTIDPDGQATLVDRTTRASTFHDRAVRYPEVTLPLVLPPGEETLVYIRYRSDGSTQTAFEIRTAEGFAAYSGVRTARNFVFYGMILFLSGAATLAFLITRQAVFAAYGTYAASALLFMMHADGNAFQYLWPSAPAFNNYASVLTGTGIIVAGANFARQFLQTARLHPVMDRILLGLILLAIGMVISTIAADTQQIKQLLVLLAFISVLLFTATGLVAARTRFREVRFYVVAWIGAVIASAIMTLRHWIGIDIPEDTQLDAMRIVMVVDAAFMGLAILDRFNQLKQARQQALQVNLDQAQRSLELSRRMQDLEKQYGLAVELADARGRRLSDTAHDLRQPLHALRLNVQAMITTPGAAGPSPEEIEKTFTYLEDLVATELHGRDIPAPAQATPTAAQEAVAIGEVLSGVRDMFLPDAEAKGLELMVIKTSTSTSLPPLALMRLVSNLVSNAVNYTQTGRVLVGIRRRGKRVRLEVHDTGPGMDQAAFDQALCRHVRLHSAGANPGSGLGLAIVQEIANTHGLKLGLIPRQSRGTSIFVSLPRAKS